jgi:hypothetical protein
LGDTCVGGDAAVTKSATYTRTYNWDDGKTISVQSLKLWVTRAPMYV